MISEIELRNTIVDLRKEIEKYKSEKFSSESAMRLMKADNMNMRGMLIAVISCNECFNEKCKLERDEDSCYKTCG